MFVKKNGSLVGKNKKKAATNANNFNENFEPPDGGWGWIIVIAAGFSNFCILPMLQSFGLIFRDRFAELGINSSQTTTILNINCAVTSCIGLANGPLFRKFSYRQIALVGATICAVSITVLSVIRNFAGIMIFFSILYGVGTGITMSSNAIALNTYFKRKRRIATGLSWTCTGIGPIVMPQIITLLMPVYGVEGTVFIFGGFAFNAVVCALLLQPVSQHLKKRQISCTNDSTGFKEIATSDQITTEVVHKKYRSLENIVESTGNSYVALNLAKNKFGSQYWYYADEEDSASSTGVIDPETPMMLQPNDECETDRSRKKVTSYESSMVPITLNESCKHIEHCKDPNCDHKIEEKLVTSEEKEADQLTKEKCIDGTTKRTLLQTLIIFFDLDLLRDYVYVNMMLGITFANFSEMNFALLTPFILGEYGFTKIQVATVMSTLGCMDVATRLIIPFIADFIGWQNRTFFLVGVCGMAVGRIVLAHIQNFGVVLAVAVLIGAGKALRTIFMALVIPTHVPLSRLPGATGIQLLTSGIISLTLGPVVGWIRDITTNYGIMLHCLNILTYLTAISWSLEICITKRRAKKMAQKLYQAN
ncbi:Monocarboxylate transporter 13 [Anthophora retusa]